MVMLVTASGASVMMTMKRGQAGMNNSAQAKALSTTALVTDQPAETVHVHRPSWLDGVTFWSVAGSVRLWTMHHDTFTACAPLGPRPQLRARWSSRGQERVARPGCVQLMEPGEAHRTLSVSDPASFFVCWWTPAAMERAAQAFSLRGGSVHFRLSQLEQSQSSAALSRLHSAIRAGATTLELDQHLADCTEALLAEAGETPLIRPRLSNHHPSVRRSLDVLHASFTESLSLDDLAQESGLSKFHLARCFRDTMGMAPHQYQKLLRLQFGRRLLETGGSVRDAALRSGFADAAHFTRAFRSWLGIAPSKWASAHS